jgi:hypothetical protein
MAQRRLAAYDAVAAGQELRGHGGSEDDVVGEVVAAAAFPSFTEKRLRRVERARSLPDGWQEMVEPWLAGWRS